jgi:single-strand DNA-binding protein
MPSFNKVVLMGNLTRDPQLKHLPSNLVVAEFGLACNRRYRTAAGDDKEEVAFVDCTAFGRQAETIGQYCTKGKPLFVEGRLKYDTWDDKAGAGKRSKLSVVVENFQFIGGKGDTEFPGDMFASTASGPEAKADRGERDGGADGGERRAAAAGDAPGKSDRWNGELPEGARRRKRGTAQQPFGEEKQFTEADIPF